jgi:hypothetical protein
MSSYDWINKEGGTVHPASYPAKGGMVSIIFPGMTLRDHFASIALGALMSSDVATTTDIARRCYSIADEMLRQRQVGRPTTTGEQP